MYTQFEQVLADYDLLTNQQKVILAVSGGVDSMVLLHLMASIPTAKRPIILVAHINHQLRPEANQEKEMVQAQAQQFGFDFYSHTWLQSDHPSSGIEEAARKVRYDFLKEVMAETKADSVMTAHHQDDQVETILMKLTRGSSLAQLTGIEAVQSFGTGQLIRPFLSFTKEAIYDYAKRTGLAYMEDQSNQKLDYTRNRFRQLVVPLLKEENPQFNTHMQQFKQDLEDLLDIANTPINQNFNALVRIQPGQVAFHQHDFEAFEPPMQRVLLHKLLATVYAGKEQTYKTNYIPLIQDWLREAKGHSRLQLAGDVVVAKSYQDITVYQNPVTEKHSEELFVRIELDESSPIQSLSESESLELRRATQEELANQAMDDPSSLLFEADRLTFPLTIRHRLPGDRMQYQGLAGSKKIKDIFIDEKTPIEERDKAWIVEDATGKIVWLIGYRKMYLLSQLETDKLTYILKYNH